MAASDLIPSYRAQMMSADSDAQDADVSTPLSPLAPPFLQSWQDDQYEPSYNQNHDPWLRTPLPHMSSNPQFQNSNYPRSPYAGYGGFHMPFYHPPNMYAFGPHHPRLPPAFRNGHVDETLASSRSDVGEGSVENDQSTSRRAPPFVPPYHMGFDGLFQTTTGYSPYSLPSHAATITGVIPNAPSSEVQQPVQTVNGRGTEHSRQFPPPLRRQSQSNQHLQQQTSRQQRQTNQNFEDREPTDTGRQSSADQNAHNRASERSVSPRTSARRSFDRYSWDSPHSSTSSDAEEAAARAPPSNRMRYRQREGRLRYLNQYRDPNLSTGRQIQELKASLPKLLRSDLPKETSPSCDICSKDYSAMHVEPSEEEEVAVQLSCGHCFGEFCIFQWFDTCKKHKNKVTCPMCRKLLVEPPSSPYAASYLHMYAARNPRPFQELLANELHAQYAQA